MKFEILLSCMHQEDAKIVERSNIKSDVLIVNQCDKDDYEKIENKNQLIQLYSTTQRGLTKSRNMAIEKSNADVCLLSDDDEVFIDDLEKGVLNAYSQFHEADVIIFKMINRKTSFNGVQRLKFPATMKVSSWQISFKRKSLLEKNVRFDELLGAGTGNGAEEELKFLLDCQKAGLKIFYVPFEIASVAQSESTWFEGFNEKFFENRGATTRYILGLFLATLYAVYYVLAKKQMYSSFISPANAFKAIMRGIKENKIAKQRKSL